MDDDRSWVEAVAIRDGTFMAVGTSVEILALAGPDTGQHDLGGAMALPGLHDAHFHTFSMTTLLDCTPGQFTPDQLRETLEHCKTRQVEGYPWLLINGMEMWNSEALNNAVVNDVFPDIPVVIRDTTMHSRLVNATALDIAGITKETPQPAGGVIQKDPETGEPTGILAEATAIALVQQHIPPYPPAMLENALTTLLQSVLEQGITSIQDAGGLNKAMLAMLATLEQQGTPIPYIMSHIVWSHRGEDWPEGDELIRDRARYVTPHVSTDAVKVFLDGVPVPPAFTHVPIGPDGEVDETNLLVPRDVLAKKLIEWDTAGLKVKMHAAGDGAIRVGLDAIEALRAANGYSGIWHEIGHTADVSPADLPRFATLKAGAEVSPYFWHLGNDTVGGTGFQFRSLHEHGALITVGSDYAVVESFNPFPPLQGIVEREGESVPIATALEFFTRNAAESNGRLDDLGTIEPGKIANMIVLDRNLLDIHSPEIGETRVLRTILDGNIVHELQQEGGVE